MKRISAPSRGTPLREFVVTACAMLAFAVTATAAEPDPAAPAPDPVAAVARGAGLWADNCSRCHNFRDARELRDDQWEVSVAHMRVRAGLTGQDSRDILAFLQGSNDERKAAAAIPASSPPLASGPLTTGTPESLYNQTCSACHGSDGKGALPGVPDFTSGKGPLAQKTGEVLANSILNGWQTPGSPMAMPAKGGNPSLTDADAAALVRYLYDRFQDGPR